jgi:hypothetical protein
MLHCVENRRMEFLRTTGTMTVKFPYEVITHTGTGSEISVKPEGAGKTFERKNTMNARAMSQDEGGVCMCSFGVKAAFSPGTYGLRRNKGRNR